MAVPLLAIGGAALGAEWMTKDIIQAFQNYYLQKAMMGMEEKKMKSSKDASRQYIDFLRQSSEADYGRAVSMKREDRASNKENMMMAMLMQNKQGQTAMMMSLINAMMQAARPQMPEPVGNFGPPSSLVSLLR
jgi:Ni,Fe-hydrogenase III component G